MFGIPEENLPDTLKDEQKLSVLFAPIRNKNVNPKDWENKVNSWRTIISLYCELNEVFTFTNTALNNAFVRNGRAPLCLNNVVQEMVANKELITLEEFQSQVSKTWSGWAKDILIKKPVNWSLNKVKSTVFGEGDKILVHTEVINKKADELLKSVSNNYINKIISLSQLLELLNKSITSVNNIKMLLTHLQKQGKIDSLILDNPLQEEAENYLIKFGEKGKVSPISESDLAIYKLELNEKNLSKQLELLEDEVEDCVNKAKENLRKGHKQSAKACLKKKHEVEKRLNKKADALHNVQVLLEKIKDSHSDTSVFDSYKQALEAFNSTFKDTSLNEDSVEDTMSKLTEALEIHDDIQGSLGRPTKEILLDESDLERELEDLINNDNKNDSPGNVSIPDLEGSLDKLSLKLPEVPESSPLKPEQKVAL